MDPQLHIRGLRLAIKFLPAVGFTVSNTHRHIINFQDGETMNGTRILGNLDKLINKKKAEMSTFLHNSQPGSTATRTSLVSGSDGEDWTSSFENVYTGSPAWTFSSVLNVFLFYYAILSMDEHIVNSSTCPLSAEEFGLWLRFLASESERLLLNDLLQLLWPGYRKVCLDLNKENTFAATPDYTTLFKGKIMGAFQHMVMSMQAQILTLCIIFPTSLDCCSKPRLGSREELFAPLLRRRDFEEFQILCEVIINQSKMGLVQYPEHSLYALTYFLCLDDHLHSKREVFRKAILDLCHDSSKTPTPPDNPNLLSPQISPASSFGAPEPKVRHLRPDPPLFDGQSDVNQFNAVKRVHNQPSFEFPGEPMSRQQSNMTAPEFGRRRSITSIISDGSTPSSNAVATPATSFGTSPPSWSASTDNFFNLGDKSLEDILNMKDFDDHEFDDYINMPSPLPNGDTISCQVENAVLKERYWNKSEKRCVYMHCQKRCSTSSNWWRHFRGTHKDASLGSSLTEETWCETCKMPLARKDAMTPHRKSKRHRDAYKLWLEETSH